MANATQPTKIESALQDAERLGADVMKATLTHYVQAFLPARSLEELADMLVGHAQALMLDPFDMDAQVQLNAVKREIIARQPPF